MAEDLKKLVDEKELKKSLEVEAKRQEGQLLQMSLEARE
jgi:hypothetical protein